MSHMFSLSKKGRVPRQHCEHFLKEHCIRKEASASARKGYLEHFKAKWQEPSKHKDSPKVNHNQNIERALLKAFGTFCLSVLYHQRRDLLRSPYICGGTRSPMASTGDSKFHEPGKPGSTCARMSGDCSTTRPLATIGRKRAQRSGPGPGVRFH